MLHKMIPFDFMEALGWKTDFNVCRFILQWQLFNRFHKKCDSPSRQQHMLTHRYIDGNRTYIMLTKPFTRGLTQ